VSKTQAFKRRVWDYKATDFNSLNTALSNAPFDSAYDIFNDVEDIVCYTNELILTTFAEFVPNTIGTVRPKDTPWMSNEVQRAIRKCDRCFKKIQRTHRDEDKLLHIIARREVNKLKREAKNRYENNIISSLSNTKLDPKKCWSLSKSIMGCNSDRFTSPL
jgi:hypothetical protein